MKKLLTTMFLMTLLSPGTTNAASSSEATYFAGKNVYIRLVKQDGGWHFSDRLSHRPSKSDEQGMDILLNDLSLPAARSPNVKVRLECIPMGHCSVNGNNFKSKKEALDSLITPWTGPFYRRDLNVATTLLSNTLGVMLTVGMAMGASDSEYTFDHKAFEKALGEAVAADGMTDERRRSIIEGMDNARGRSVLTARAFHDQVALAQ